MEAMFVSHVEFVAEHSGVPNIIVVTHEEVGEEPGFRMSAILLSLRNI